MLLSWYSILMVIACLMSLCQRWTWMLNCWGMTGSLMCKHSAFLITWDTCPYQNHKPCELWIWLYFAVVFAYWIYCFSVCSTVALTLFCTKLFIVIILDYFNRIFVLWLERWRISSSLVVITGPLHWFLTDIFTPYQYCLVIVSCN